MYPSIDFPLSQGEDLETLRISVVLPCAGEASLCKVFDFFHQPMFAVSVICTPMQIFKHGFCLPWYQSFVAVDSFHMFSHVFTCFHITTVGWTCQNIAEPSGPFFSLQGLYALNTVRAVYESLPPGVLHEIIVVDDGTEPPLAQSFLTPDVLEKFQVTILRHVPWLHLASLGFNRFHLW